MNWLHYFYYKLYKSASFIENKLFKLRGGPTGAVTGIMGLLFVTAIIPTFLYVSRINEKLQWIYEIGFLIVIFVLFWFLDSYFEKKHELIYNRFKNESQSHSITGAIIVNLSMTFYLYLIFKYVYP